MKRLIMSLMLLAICLMTFGGNPKTALAQEMAPPGGEFKKVSSLVQLPDFLPGIGWT
ncbi:MAG TPA: hypothetical protein VFF49_10155 [Thermodesulfobacteriota bacterium]|nr:hypothetical protein [Thermodesulfobacteriota bacterium]